MDRIFKPPFSMAGAISQGCERCQFLFCLMKNPLLYRSAWPESSREASESGSARTNARYFDLPGLFGLCGFSKLADFQQAHRQWVEIALRDELSVRDALWSEAVAVGNLNFVEKMKSEKRGGAS